MKGLDAMSTEALRTLEARLSDEHVAVCRKGLRLDLTRGKPATDQLELSNVLDGILQGDFRAEDGTDVRNYGSLLGIPEARRLGGLIMEIEPELVLAGGNSSLFLMYLYVETAHLFGAAGPASSWREEAESADRAQARVKFLCPVPGYDRHFTICESLGIEMISVPMLDTGPDMDTVEACVRDDPLVKGIWCVPKYSNPTGITYSPEVVARIARLGNIAGAHFRVMWDNAYAVHDLDSHADELTNIVPLVREAGTEDSLVTLASTSKITYAGGGVAFLAASAANLQVFQHRLSAMIVSFDKVNQLRHARLLPDMDAVHRQMQRQAELVKPRFEHVLDALERELGGSGLAEWTRPRGGYFISVDVMRGLARETIALAGQAGLELTPAGATYPLGQDPMDANVRIAPTFAALDEIDPAMDVFVLCVKLAAVRQRIAGAEATT